MNSVSTVYAQNDANASDANASQSVLEAHVRFFFVPSSGKTSLKWFCAPRTAPTRRGGIVVLEANNLNGFMVLFMVLFRVCLGLFCVCVEFPLF